MAPDSSLCRNCNRSPVSAALQPCGHRASCSSCVSSFRTCPQCGRNVGASARQNQDTPSWQICRGCNRNKISVVLDPCRHLASCSSCVRSMRNCPQCGRTVGAALQGVKLR